MSPAGDATYLQNCSMCHVNGSEQNLPHRPESGDRSSRLDQSGAGPLLRLAADVTFRSPRRRTSSRIPTRWERAAPFAMPPARSSRSTRYTRNSMPYILAMTRLALSAARSLRLRWRLHRGSRANASGGLRRLGDLQGLSRRHLQRVRQEPASRSGHRRQARMAGARAARPVTVPARRTPRGPRPTTSAIRRS